MLVLILK